ncbi:hypothetical protein GGX14DRAFT_386721 [Mycena pura]|uniref:Uncharacterized protein n=1 Tax=Mycena pura TaxID=153505 RepID=A0AAD6YQA5_9AGAR|nr:hypothetical protein GGX14DRAFT_386721 [Mycena pura]
MSGNASGSQPNPPPPTTGNGGNEEVVRKCKALIQDFRDRKISKGIACSRIANTIPTAFVEGGSGEQAVQAYIEELDQIERELTEAAQRGSRGGADPGPGVGRPEEGPEDGEHRGRSRSRSPHADDERASREGRHRRRSSSPSPHAGHSRKRRVDDSKLPWLVDNYLQDNLLSESLRRSRIMLEEFSAEPSYVLSTLLNSTRRVPFPTSEYLAIIKGEAVNLDKVISYQFSVDHEQHRTETVADGVSLLFGSSTPNKKVTTQADWITAWAKTADAIQSVFPHRRAELEVYRQYVMDLFTTSGSHIHDRVILLDRRIRNEVAG